MKVCIKVIKVGGIIVAYLISVVDCGVPLSANQVVIERFNITKFGALITFHCEESKDSMTAECGSDGEWIPNPASLVCGESGNMPSGTCKKCHKCCI